jgi:transposase, IS5 family
LKRRQAVEPAIGHTKHDNGMIHCYLKGSVGDSLNAISCAAGYNIRWLLRAIMRLGLKGLFALAFLVLARLILRRLASTMRRIRSQQDHATLPAYFAC